MDAKEWAEITLKDRDLIEAAKFPACPDACEAARFRLALAAKVKEDIDALHAKYDRAVKLIQQLEWEAESYGFEEFHVACPCCYSRKSKGRHNPDCELAAILQEAEQ